MLTAKDIVPLVLGPGWTDTSFILIAFCPGIAATLIYGTHSWLHLALGTPGRWLRWNLFSMLIVVTAFIIAAPYGAVAMAAASSVATYILVLPGLWYAGRPIKLRIFALLGCLWPYFTAGIFVSVLWFFAPIYWSRLNFMLADLGSLGRVILIVCVAPIIYSVTVIALHRNFNSIRDIISLLKSMLSHKAT